MLAESPIVVIGPIDAAYRVCDDEHEDEYQCKFNEDEVDGEPVAQKL